MKKLLLSFSLLFTVGSFAQSVYSYGFDVPTATVFGADGWAQTNQSTPLGASTFIVPTAASTVFTTGGQAGGPLSFVLVNFNSTTGAGTISNWLISPEIGLKDGDVVSFYTRTATYNAAPTPANTFPDRLEMRVSTNGSFSQLPTGGSEGLGDFTELVASVNPTLALTGYPDSWTQFSWTVDGLGSDPIACKVALRYFVTDGGPSGANSNIIAIDSFNVDRPLSTDSFFSGNFTVSPNPTADILKIANNTGINVNTIEVTDMNGRVVKQVKGMADQINISELNAGVYFLKIASDKGTGTTKIIKK